jgi:LmbE family N-acetylglucosaminyl deacetylase
VARALTAVFAHPDDETYPTGATLARYASDGVRCSLYCATDGDAGQSSGIPVSSRAALGRLRRAELDAACAILGIGVVDHGGHADGQLAAADPDVVIGQIVSLIRRERPDVVITFGPEGAPTRHRDHRAICRLATSAYLLAATETEYPEQLVDGVRPHRAARLCYTTWRRPASGALYGTEGQPADVAIDARPWNSRKREAYLAHATQQQHRDGFERSAMADVECYFVAAGPPAPAGASDLFAGLA